jgi:hypothetical protein
VPEVPESKTKSKKDLEKEKVEEAKKFKGLLIMIINIIL